MGLKIFFAVIGLLYIAAAAKEDYCDPTLCDDGLTHIACEHDQVSYNNSDDQWGQWVLENNFMASS